MNCRLPIDLDRYRRLKDKGKVSPRVGAAVVGSSPANTNASFTPSPSHQRSMMPIANAYRGTPETPPVTSPFSWTSTFQRANCNSDEANNVKTITAVSLFEDSRRQRYAKFRSRVRDSQSPKTHQGESPVLQHTSEHEQREEQTQARQQGDQRITSIESYYEDSHNDKYAMKRIISHHEPERHDKYAYSNGLQKNDKQDSGRTPTRVSPSKRSAFKTPKYFPRRQSQSPANKVGSSSTNRFPSPPSVTPSQQLSNHPLNSVGLPIASSRHNHATPRKAEDNQSNFRSVIKLDNTKGVLSSPSTGLLSEKRAYQPINGIYNVGLPTSGRQSSGLQREQSNHERPRPEDPYNSKPFPVVPAEIRKKPILEINTTSTPTSKPPTLAQSSSSLERGVTPPPFRPPNSKTPISFEGSQETTSTERRDRILEARGMEHSSGLLESREPLGEMRRIPTDSRVNIRELSPRVPRPAQEKRPHNGAKASSETQLQTPVKNTSELSDNENTPRGVTPLDFYRRITAEKSRQVARARQLSGSTPTKDFPSPSRISTPVFRANSPRSFSAPVLDQRTVRLLYSREFNQMIREHSQRHTSKLLEQFSIKKNDRRDDHGISLFARKRPLLEDEIANGEFDVVNATTGRSNTMIVYITSMLSDLQTKDIQPKVFMFDQVFSEEMLAEEIYIRLAQTEVMRAREGGAASFVFVGSQGSGKTHSMADIEERIAYDLFESARGPRPGFVAVQYLELSGNRIVDLLGPSNNLVRIVNEAKSYQLKGSTIKSASSPRDLLAIMSEARRRLNNTSANQWQQDPPGYVLCHISVDLQWTKGTLILLDCPACEMTRSRDGSSMFNGLMARIKAKGEGRSKESLFQGENNITKIMHDVLENPKGRISLLAAISPAASHTEQTTALLESLSSLAGGNVKNEPTRNAKNEPTRNVTVASPQQQGNDSPKSVTSSGEVPLPRQWSQVELEEWMRRKNLLVRSVPPDVNGRVAMRMTKGQLKSTFYNVTDNAKAERLYMALRAENDRVARMRVKVRMARERQKLME